MRNYIHLDIIKEDDKVHLPEYSTDGSSGMDVRARIDKPITIKPSERVLINTGLRFNIPNFLEMQIRPRSGLALKHGITVLNSPGTIDSDFQGIVGIILINHGNKDFIVKDGDRIAQLVLVPFFGGILHEIDHFINESERKDGGFGHTGVE